MLTLYRRHLKTCPHTSRKQRMCKCPLWIDGTLGGEEVRRALDLSSWDAGQRLVREIEIAGSLFPLDNRNAGAPTIPEAVEHFFSDTEDRNLSPATVTKYNVLLRKQLLPFCLLRGFIKLSQLGVQELRDFRATWKDEALAALKKLERLRSFFRFCVESKWMEENPARKVQMPKVPPKPTLPFTPEDMKAVWAACDTYPLKGIYGAGNRDRVTAFVMVLRYTGLRIGDVVQLKREAVKDGKVFLYTQKTGTPVWIPVPPFVTAALARVPYVGKHFFWSGEGKLKSSIADWQRTLRRLFALAKIDGGHAHRFRDTFAVELLLAGVAIEDVAILLGHSSKDITEKHYAPWVAARQARLENAVKQTWPQHNLRVIEGGA